MLLSLKAFLVFWFAVSRIPDVAHQFNFFIENFINPKHPYALDFPVWWSYLAKAALTKHNASSDLGKSLGLVME